MATRQRIVEAADRLFYECGFEHTSFTDIADVVKISRGNFYYHFKTKDQILDAVIDHRLAGRRALLAQWEADGDDPAARIRSFIHIMTLNRDKILRYGCPVGTLCTELAKLDHPSRDGANRIMSLFHTWLRRQFVAHGRGADADDLAMQLLARSQGVASLANAFHDERFLAREVARMCDWLDTRGQDAGMPAQEI